MEKTRIYQDPKGGYYKFDAAGNQVPISGDDAKSGNYSFVGNGAQQASVGNAQNVWSSPSFQNYLNQRNLKNPYDVNSTNPNEKAAATQWLQQVQQQSINNAGMPNRPEFVSQIDQNTGLLNKKLQQNPNTIAGVSSALPDIEKRLGNVQVNQQGLGALRGEALRQGPSAWANLMKQNLGNQQTAALDANAAQAQGSNAAAADALAMRGGLGSGARTSLAKDMARNINAGAQGIRRNTQNQGLGVDIQDESNRMDILKGLPGQEIAAVQPELAKANSINNAQLGENAQNLGVQQYNADTANASSKFNIQNALNETLQQRGYDVNSYNEAMKAFAAGKSADATANAGKK